MVEEPNKSQQCLAWREVWVLVALSLAFRYCLSLNPFSGKNTPPMFGDMEAQRHWMEITVNLPLYDWYRNTTENDLMYWGLDYPPLTAFHEYCMGRIAKWWYPAMVELGSSHGFETDQSILFMRCSVLIADCLVYIPACVFFLRTCLRGFSYEKQRSCFLLMLFMPPLVLIDHAHFQYNAVCLGFVLLAITCVSLDWDCVGSFFFVMAIGYKQIALYYSLVFFVWLLRKCFVKGPLHLVRIGATVVLSFALLFFPFLLHLPEDLTPVGSLLHVVHRMFPWDRWLFEDKVASFWCTVNNVVKLNRLFSAERLKLLCTLLTLAACLPSLVLLWRKPSLPSALFSLFSCALSFFLFSYQVHEKTILFPLLPMVLLAPSEPEMVMVFTYFASYSMIPLYVKDHNLLMAVAVMVGFLVLVPKEDLSKGWRLLMCFSALVFGYYAFPPPARYPDLHSVFLSAFSCFVFSLFYLVMLKKQWEAAKTVSRVCCHTAAQRSEPHNPNDCDPRCFLRFAQIRITWVLCSLFEVPLESHLLVPAVVDAHALVRRLFSEAPVVKIISDEAPKAVTAAEGVKAIATEIPKPEPVKPEPVKPKEEPKKESSQKKRGSFRPFLYGFVLGLFVEYFVVHRDIWQSGHQIEQSIADINVDVSDSIDHLEQRVDRLEAQLKEL